MIVVKIARSFKFDQDDFTEKCVNIDDNETYLYWWYRINESFWRVSFFLTCHMFTLRCIMEMFNLHISVSTSREIFKPYEYEYNAKSTKQKEETCKSFRLPNLIRWIILRISSHLKFKCSCRSEEVLEIIFKT